MLGTVFCAIPTYGANNAKVSVTVKEGCNVTATDTEHTSSLTPGTSGSIGTGSKFTITCNDPNGYVVYAVGSSKGDDGVEAEGNTDLLGVSHGDKITTGLDKSGEASSWQFKLSNPTGGLTINNGFDQDSVIPNTRTAVAIKESGTSASTGDSFTANYSAYISPAQVADAYNGKVKYILFHPSTSDSEGKLPAPTTMQDFGGYCDSMEQDEVLSLEDTRDGNTYKIAKLKDGKCWMVENLRLGDDKLQNNTLTSDNTDLAAKTFFIPKSQDESNFSSSAGVRRPSFYVTGDDTYGNYYNWYAATAGDGIQMQGSGDAVSSICPRGWKLPTANEAYELADNYSDIDASQPPTNFIYSGACSEGDCQEYQEYMGLWWTSSVYDNENPYALLSEDGSNLRLDNYWSKNDGLSIRCVARPEGEKLYTINYKSAHTWGICPDDRNAPSPQTGTTTKNEVTIDHNPYAYCRETFGWCTEYTNDETCSGTTYHLGDSIPLSNSNLNIDLWVIAGPQGSSCSDSCIGIG